MGSFPGMLMAAMLLGHRREHHRDLLRAVLVAGGGVRLPAADLGLPPDRHHGTLDREDQHLLAPHRGDGRHHLRPVAARHQRLFLLRLLSRAAIRRAVDRLEHPGRLYRLCEFRHRRVLRASAPIRAVVLHKLVAPPIPVSILVGGVLSGVLGLGMGYLTLRAPRACSSRIATLALAVVLQTLRHQLGLCRRLARRLHHPPGAGAAHRQLHPVSLSRHADPGRRSSVAIARTIEHSTLGYGLATDPRRRAVGRGVGRADAAPQAHLDDLVAARSWAWRARRCPITSPISIPPRASTCRSR